MRLAVRGVLALLLAGCSRAPTVGKAAAVHPNAAASTPASTVDAARDDDHGSAEWIARTLLRVSEARHLTATRSVPGVRLPRDGLILRLKDHVAREVPHEAIRQEGLVLQLLGFIPAKFDYEKETYALLESQLAGFYEPKDGTMYMASDLDGDNATATLAHELVHALQDQHWDLGKRSQYAPGQGDRSGAFSALAEGDATSAMADILLATVSKGATALDLPEEIFREQVLAGLETGATANVPHIMKTSLVAPYIDGTLFVHALRRRGGWDAVDRAWDAPPATTEQILHVEKWDAREAAIPVESPSVETWGAGFTRVDDDVYGELGTRLAFEEWMDAKASAIAAAGWGGDRGVLVRNGDTYGFAWHVRFDASVDVHGEAFAGRAWASLAAAFASRTKGTDRPPFLCVERKGLGPLAMARRGRDLFIVVGPTTIDSRGVPSSETTCVEAKKRVLAIAGAH